MTRIIGITGGIGSGKSTLALCFRAHNVPVFDADAISRFALTPASACFADAIALFGDRALKPDGTADRAYIASMVFEDRNLRHSLNAIIHPFVQNELLRLSESCDAPLAVWDVPLLFESGLDAYCACTVAVLCDEEIRIARAKLRDGTDEEQIRARIRAQMNDEARESLATYTIRNEGTMDDFFAEADALIAKLREELD
ncbi:MAG: dephospho-CoA kinase [Clostridia bacterium]|nr:dephospho-CoA kinase [Clostridia bacterium]